MVEPIDVGGNERGYTSMADKTGSDHKEKSLYLVQIWYLDEQLERCVLKYDELEKEHKDLWCQYRALEKDKNSVTEKLKCAVAEKQRKVEELVEQLEKQQRQSELEREALELQHRQEVEEVEGQRNKVESEIKTQAINMEEQQEQLVQVKHRLSCSKSLEEQLAGQRKKHEAVVHSLRTEIETEKKSAAATVQKMADSLLQRELCNILREERAQHTERQEWLRFLLGNKEPLEREKKILQDTEGEVRVRLQQVWVKLRKMKRERSVHKKEMKKLKEKRQQMMEEQENWDLSDLLEHIDSLREQISSVSEACCDRSAEADQLEAELRQERSRSLQLGGVRQEAAIILRHILTDSARCRGAEAQRLLDILESTAPQGEVSSLR